MALFGIDEVTIFKYEVKSTDRKKPASAKSGAGISVAYAIGGIGGPKWLDKKDQLIGIEVPLVIASPYNEGVAIEDIRIDLKHEKYILKSESTAQVNKIGDEKLDIITYPILLGPMEELWLELLFPSCIYLRFVRNFHKKLAKDHDFSDIEDENSDSLRISPYEGTIAITTNKGVLRYKEN